jgi:His/Glu/Gln/Arg/opine family amino acid ABC transporter permease subunit
MDTGTAFQAREPPKLVTSITLIHLVEMVVAGLLMAFVILPAIFDFSLLSAQFWSIYTRFYITGLFGTFFYVALTLPLSVVLGFLMGWARVSRFRIFSWPASLYVNVFRGLPPLILVIFASLFGTSLVPQPILDRFFAGFRRGDIAVGIAAIAIGMHSSAYQAEIFRAGFQSVPKGQVEASQALGLKSWQGMRHVILPQTFRLSLPPLGNEFAVLIKDTSILAAISGTELVAESRELLGSLPANGLPIVWIFAVWTVVALTYFVLTYTVTRGLRLLERKFHTPGLEGISL